VVSGATVIAIPNPGGTTFSPTDNEWFHVLKRIRTKPLSSGLFYALDACSILFIHREAYWNVRYNYSAKSSLIHVSLT
jgi:hypothetical protein